MNQIWGSFLTYHLKHRCLVAEQIAHRQQHLQALKDHLTRAQNKIKLTADKKRKDYQFAVGDQVLLKLQPYTQSSLVNRPYPKLAYKYYGPFAVLQRIGKVAYRLYLPQSSSIHPVFHISQLKPYTPDFTPVYDTLPVLTDLEAADSTPQEILEHRMVKKGNTAVPLVKVSWSGLLSSVAT